MAGGDQWHHARIQAPQAWDATVAVIDSGVDPHPDLSVAYDPAGNAGVAWTRVVVP